MIQLNKDNNAEYIICTPLELLSSVPAYYYFKFVSRQTNAVVQFTAQDLSTTQRYQKFLIDTASKFATQKEGLWKYIIKPASSNNNLEPNTDICESGLMYLVSDDTFEPTKYEDQANTIKAYSK